MPRKMFMSWEGEPNFRWRKMHKGERYGISCDELGCARTKDASWQAANNWWLKITGTIAQEDIPTKKPEVYFLLDKKNDIIKIGHSEDVDARVKSIAQGHPYLEVIGRMPGDAKTESALHYLFRKANVSKEWFNYGKIKLHLQYFLD